MKCVTDNQVVLIRPPEGPLAAFIRPFAGWASEQGYVPDSLRQRIRIATGFSQWLGEKALRPPNIHSQHCTQYLRYRARRLRIQRCDAIALGQFLEFLRRQGVTAAEKAPLRRLTPVDRCAQDFERYLREERVLAQATIVYYVPFSIYFSLPLHLNRSAVCRVQRQIRDFSDAWQKSYRIRGPWSGFQEVGRYLCIPQNCHLRLVHAHRVPQGPLRTTRQPLRSVFAHQCALEGYWGAVADRGMTSMRFIPTLDPLKDRQLRLRLRVEATPIEQFTLQRGKKRFRHRVIVGIADRTDRQHDTHFAAALAEGEARILTTVVGMMDDAQRPPLVRGPC